MVEDAVKYKAKDLKKRNSVLAMNELQSLINKMRSAKNVSEVDKKKLVKAAIKGEEFMENNENANMEQVAEFRE